MCVCVCVRARARRECQQGVHPHRVRSDMVHFVVGQRDLPSILPLWKHRTSHESILAPTEVRMIHSGPLDTSEISDSTYLHLQLH